jgi:hypothetical protein
MQKAGISLITTVPPAIANTPEAATPDDEDDSGDAGGFLN